MGLETPDALPLDHQPAMTDDLSFIVDRLEGEGERSLAFFRDLPPEVWDQTVYTEGARWRVREVLAHLVEAESSVARLIRHVVRGGPGVPEDFDLNAYNEREVVALAALDIPDLLARFAEARASTVSMVKGFQPSDLAKTGRHPFLGVAPVSAMLKLMYRHNQIHQRELRRALTR